MKHDSNGHPRTSSQEVRALIARYRASDLGLAQFAQEQGVPAGRLHYWLYQKHRSGGPSRSPQRAGSVSAPVFQEVKFAAGLPPAPGWAAEISLPSGLVLRFNPAAMPAWISAVVQSLQRPC